MLYIAVRKFRHVGIVSMSCLWILPHEHFWCTAYDDFIVQLKTFDEILNVFRSYLMQYYCQKLVVFCKF